MRLANCVLCGEEFEVRAVPRDKCRRCRKNKTGRRTRTGTRPTVIMSRRDVKFAPKSFVPEPDPRPPELVAERPVTRADCAGGERPCPWVSCRHHLYLDADPITGAIKLNFPDLEPWELTRSCALDIADSAGVTLEEVGQIVNLTRERIRQLETRALITARGPMRAVR